MKWTKQLEQFFTHKHANKITNDFPREEEFENSAISSDLPESLPIDFNLRMLIIADPHGCLGEYDIPRNHNADVCFLLGDLSARDIAIIKAQVVGVPIYGVLGNHDGFDLYCRSGVENIHGKVVEIKGVKIAGIQGSLRYKYSEAPLYTDDESVEIAEAMEAADILISHDGPKFLHGINDYAHSGLQGVTHYCEKHNTPLNIHGHHHDNTKNVLENGTTSICCYRVQIIDTEDLKKVQEIQRVFA